MLRTMAIAVIALGLASPALAGTCPKLMKQIDAAMSDAEISEEEMAQVMELRAEGEDLHKAKKHGDSVDALNLAKDILGIE